MCASCRLCGCYTFRRCRPHSLASGRMLCVASYWMDPIPSRASGLSILALACIFSRLCLCLALAFGLSLYCSLLRCRLLRSFAFILVTVVESLWLTRVELAFCQLPPFASQLPPACTCLFDSRCDCVRSYVAVAELHSCERGEFEGFSVSCRLPPIVLVSVVHPGCGVII